MGMKAEGYGGIMRNDGSVRHMLTEDYVIRKRMNGELGKTE